VAAWFEGGQLPTVRRFPFTRGKSRFKPLEQTSVPVNVGRLSTFKPDTEITAKALVAAKIISSSQLKHRSVKILGGGKITVPLIIKVPTSQKAADKITAAGGRIDRGSST
jgi:large subunit ribosomal protein L15